MAKSADRASVSLVMLVHNEADVIESVVRDFHAKTVGRIPDSEFIIAEDGSTDGTKEILDRLSREIPMRIVTGGEKKGYTRALVDALRLARKDLILFSDSDGQHEPDDFWAMYALMDEHDMVVGCKVNRKDEGYRLFVSKIMNAIINLVFAIPLADVNCGYRLMRREVVDEVMKDGLAFPDCVFTEFTIKAWNMGYRVVESPIRHYKRDFGESRGLPSKRIPFALLRMLYNLFRLKLTEKKRGSAPGRPSAWVPESRPK